MKLQLKNFVAVMAMAIAFTSCSSDDDTTITGEGNLKLEFDNVYGSADFAIGTNYTNSNGEVLNVSRIKYIISNVVLIKADGSTYTVPKNESYFIVDELTSSSTLINLANVPAADYKAIKFGIGVDKEQWELGADGQGDFLAIAQNAQMMWSWSAGYKFLNFEGTFTSATVADATEYKVHTGQTGTDYNYAEVTLNFEEGDVAQVRTTVTPQIHIMTDLQHITDGTNKINLSEQATVMGGSKLALVTNNITNMFEVHHVHND